MKTRTKASTNGIISKNEIKNGMLARKVASEGIILLKNENILPISGDKIALFGNGARMTVKGGTGSGDVHERHSISIEEGLENAGYTITTKKYISEFEQLYQMEYKKWDEQLQQITKKLGPYQIFEAVAAHPFPVPFSRKISEKDVKESDTDTAIYVIARQAGEGKDRKNEPGDFKITSAEYEDLNLVAKQYKNTIVVINIGGMIDLSFMDEIEGINALLYFVQAGQEGGNALVDILTGKVSPSGKLTDTWAMSYTDYPSADTFSYINGNLEDEEYKEGIYVGYRYFDSFQIKPRFEFGYGLSYTDFSICVNEITIEKSQVNVKVDVKNIGKVYAGKEVVQLYLSAPEKNIKREYQSLVAFQKTKELEPGATQQLVLSFDLTDSAAYEEKSASWILENGKYVLCLGNSSKNTKQIAAIRLEEPVVVEKCINVCKIQKPFHEIEAPNLNHMVKEHDIIEFKIDSKSFQYQVNGYNKLPIASNEEVSKIIDKLTEKELIELIVGAGQIGKCYNLTSGAVGRTTSALQKKGLSNINMVDGPAGVNVNQKFMLTKRGKEKYVDLPPFFNYGLLKKVGFLMTGNEKKDVIHYQYCTAWPVETLQAQTWNLTLMEEIGQAVSREMDKIGATLWLAPGMNIHRNPLCGRNFEYYSEDPYLTGKLAAALTRGVQSVAGIGATIKHFACNNQEDNRMKVSSNVKERALREIYLKAFRMVVLESKPMALMTSYNRLNGVYTANSFDLCTKVLRNEWGYKGLVMSDWDSTGEGKAGYEECVVAGNDIIMPGNKKIKKAIYKSLIEKEVTIEEIKRCAANVLQVVLKSKIYKEMHENE